MLRRPKFPLYALFIPSPRYHHTVWTRAYSIDNGKTGTLKRQERVRQKEYPASKGFEVASLLYASCALATNFAFICFLRSNHFPRACTHNENQEPSASLERKRSSSKRDGREGERQNVSHLKRISTVSCEKLRAKKGTNDNNNKHTHTTYSELNPHLFQVTDLLRTNAPFNTWVTTSITSVVHFWRFITS